MKFPAKTLIALAVAGVIAPGAALAAKVEAKLGGQISRMISYADNGIDDDVLHVDNNNSGTRIRLRGATDLGNGMKAGINWETDWQFNDSASMDIGDADLDKTPENRLRDLFFEGAFGKLSMGRGNGAANGTSEIDYSGTWIASNSGDFHLSGLNFRQKDGTEFGSVVGSYGTFIGTNFDGLSRNNRLRYDTPALGPAVLSADFGQEKWELAARLSQKLAGGGKVGGAIGYVDCGVKNEDARCSGGGAGVKFDQIGLSASFAMANGFNLTGAYGKRSIDSVGGVNAAGLPDPKMWYLKAGWISGPHHISANYKQTDNLGTIGSQEGKKYGIEYVHNMKDHGVELYAGLWKAELKDKGNVTGIGPIEDLNGLFVGSRVKF